MTKKFPVRTLSDLSLSELANYTVAAFGLAMQTEIEDNIYMVKVKLNSYLEESGATCNVYQELLKIILTSDYLEASLRFICLEALLNEGVHNLVTEIFPYSYYDRILKVIAEKGTGLKYLNLKGIWIKQAQSINLIYEIIQNLPNLTTLSIPYIANDEILEEIAKYSPNLKILDISGETDITEIGLEALSLGVSFQNLKIVDIGTLGEENICHTDIALLILHLPNLINLVTYSYVGRSLLYITETYNSDFKCRLKYVHDTSTSDITMDAIVNTCPDLENIYIDSPCSGVIKKFSKLKLNQLKLYKFDCNEFIDVLDKIGHNLSQITLIKGKGVFDIGKLAKHSPGLIHLNCYMMEQLSYTIDGVFNGLQGLEILSSPLATLSLKYFICKNIKLKRLVVDSVNFGDEDIASIFLEHNFNNLEDIWFTSAINLTVLSVEILMERCPELQSLGQLSGWAVTPDDLQLIRALLKSDNSCLVLSPTGLFP